jgi:hypothetical protein
MVPGPNARRSNCALRQTGPIPHLTRAEGDHNEQVPAGQEILDNAVGGPEAPVAAFHGAFWRDLTRDEFVAFDVLGQLVATLGDGDESTIVKALRGQEPFGQDIGTPGATFRRMPAGRLPVPPDQIAVIATWIDDGCPDEDEQPFGPVESLLNSAPSGEGFVIVSTPEHPLPGTLTVRTTDGSQADVSVRPGQPGGATLSISPSTIHLSGKPVDVQVLATTQSGSLNDTSVEVVRGAEVLARHALTAIQTPAVRFTGRFQCRLATDPDPFDQRWGEESSFGLYAVQGPDPDHPDEPPLDRIVRFQDAVSLRPFCRPIGVSVVGIEAKVGGALIRFTAGDRLLGQPVRLGPNCKFDGRNRSFAPNGFEPISDFRLEIGSLFGGASAPGVPRPSSQDPPGSTAPYADGIYELDIDPTPWAPSDFGYSEATWAERAWALVAQKLARLAVQQPTDDRAARIRDRRLKEHGPNRIAAIRTPVRLMERYTGLVDRDVTIDSSIGGALAYLAMIPTIQFSAEFFDFDTDCQTGTVTGTLRAPAPVEAAPDAVLASSRFRRTAAPDA